MHALRCILGTATVVTLSYAEDFWWIPGIPWIAICITGLLAIFPFLFIAMLGAAGAQADWMSDAFVIVAFFAAPTIASIVISEITMAGRTARRNRTASSVDSVRSLTPNNEQNKPAHAPLPRPGSDDHWQHDPQATVQRAPSVRERRLRR